MQILKCVSHVDKLHGGQKWVEGLLPQDLASDRVLHHACLELSKLKHLHARYRNANIKIVRSFQIKCETSKYQGKSHLNCGAIAAKDWAHERNFGFFARNYRSPTQGKSLEAVFRDENTARWGKIRQYEKDEIKTRDVDNLTSSLFLSPNLNISAITLARSSWHRKDHNIIMVELRRLVN